jgi:hypothetical protein
VFRLASLIPLVFGLGLVIVATVSSVRDGALHPELLIFLGTALLASQSTVFRTRSRGLLIGLNLSAMAVIGVGAWLAR